MTRTYFPLSNGIVVQENDKKVVATISPIGKKTLNSFKEPKKMIFLDFPFLRGWQYFFCGIYTFFMAFFQNTPKKQKKDKFAFKLTVISTLCVIFGIVVSAVLLGFVPGKVAYLLVDYRGNAFLRNFVVMAVKILIFCLLIASLRFFASFSELLRFNRASDMMFFSGDKIKKQKCPARPLNFLNFLVFVFICDFAVVSLVGASFGFWLNLIFHILAFLLVICIAYEILWILERVKILRNLAWLTAFLVYGKPTTTHLETAFMAFTEMNLLAVQKDREFMDNQKHSFTVVYSEVREKLAAAGINDKSDADWLVATVLGKNRAEIKLVSSVTDKQYEEILKATARRVKGESLDNIFGYTEFYGLRFDVNKKVLTPRMETEILVENVIKTAKKLKNPTVLDIGTGSGAIAVAVAKNCQAHVTALDISKSALAVAQSNAEKHDVKIEFLHSNLFENLKRKRKFDIIVSNPPYIKSSDIKNLDKNVKECDPILALDGGEDGLDFYRIIIPNSVKHLTSGGTLWLEIGKGQGAAVRKLMRQSGFEEIKTIKDYNKIERIITGKIR